MAIISLSKTIFSLLAIIFAHDIYKRITRTSHLRTLSRQKGCQPCPSRISSLPWPIPTFGIDHIVSSFRSFKRRTLLEDWTNMLRQLNAHTMSITMLGTKLFLTDDPENIKTMLATQFEDWSLGQERIESMAAFLGHGVFTNEGQAWRHSRDMLRPCFERHQVADTALLEKHTNRLIALLPTDGETVDLAPLLHELTLDIATEFLFGRSTGSLERGEKSEDVEKFVDAFEYCVDPARNKNFKRFGYVGLMLPDKKKKESAKVIQAFADQIIDQELARQSSPTAKTTPESRYIFLDALTSATDSRTTIRSELLNILLAGRDTTAALLSNVLWQLPREPSVLARLTQEITQTCGNDAPTYEQLKNMKYLQAILKESQRIYPVVPSNSREALRDTILPRGGGKDGLSPILVPKGCYVAYHTYALHRRTDIYGPDANTFNPSRWLDSDTQPSLRPGWAYLPFSGGPRVCIGQNFALTEVGYVVVRLVQGFEMSGEEEVWREKLTLTCIGAGGCRVGLKRRGV